MKCPLCDQAIPESSLSCGRVRCPNCDRLLRRRVRSAPVAVNDRYTTLPGHWKDSSRYGIEIRPPLPVVERAPAPSIRRDAWWVPIWAGLSYKLVRRAPVETFTTIPPEELFDYQKLWKGFQPVLGVLRSIGLFFLIIAIGILMAIPFGWVIVLPLILVIDLFYYLRERKVV